MDLTAVIPCYNPDPAHLREAIGSVMRSTLPPAEVVLVDDGSSDPRAVDEWLAVPGVRVVRHAHNRGLAAARNTGMAEARTPLVLQLDADDLIDPTFLEKAAWALHAHPEWAFVNAWVTAFGARAFTWDRGFERGRDFLAENQVTSLAVVRRAADALVGGHSEDLRHGLEDWDYWLKMAAHGLWGGTIPEYLLFYRQHARPHDWADRDDAERKLAFRRGLLARYPQLKRGAWPKGQAVPEGAGRVEHAQPAQPPQTPPKHLLMLVPWFSLGGVDRYNLTLIEGLKRRGWSLTVCATTRGPHDWVDDYTAVTADCFILPHFLPARNQPEFLSHLIGSRGVSHVLITHAMLGYRLLPYLRAHHPQVAFVDYNHMVASDWPSGGYPGQGARTQALLDLNIVSSEMVRQWMIAQGADAARIAVSYTGVDTTIWDPGRFDRQTLRHQHGVHDQRPVLIFAGRLVAQKRPELFIEIVRGLQARGLSVVAWIAGEGPLRPKIERAIRLAGLQDTVRLLGALPADEVPALLAAGDVLVLPSRNEGIALILFEAMALGLPVVSADVGGQRELMGVETGILIAPGRDELAGYVEAVAGLLVDPARRAQLGAAARQRVASRFDLADTLAQMEGLLQQAAELAAAAPRQAPNADEAERLVTDVIADLEYDRLQEQLRVPDAARAASGWRARLAHVAKQRILRPAYYWGLRQGIPGLDRAATWAFRRLRWLLG